MKKIYFTTLLTLIALSFCNSQTLPQPQSTLPSGWQRIYVKNVGNFDLPPTMEIQSGKYKQVMNEYYKSLEYDAPQIVAQQKGLNESGEAGSGKYGRAMIETTIGAVGEYGKLNFNIATFSISDIAEANSSYKQETQESLLETGFKLIEWYPLKLEKFNGMSCIHISYKRQLKERPIVLVHMYMFNNIDRMHTLMLSYRISEADYWKMDFSTILKSLRISNVK